MAGDAHHSPAGGKVRDRRHLQPGALLAIDDQSGEEVRRVPPAAWRSAIAPLPELGWIGKQFFGNIPESARTAPRTQAYSFAQHSDRHHDGFIPGMVFGLALLRSWLDNPNAVSGRVIDTSLGGSQGPIPAERFRQV